MGAPHSSSPLVDILWEGVPNWAGIVIGFLTLIAAVAAAWFARSASRAAREQADAASQQTAAAIAQLELASAAARRAEEQATEQDSALKAERRRGDQARLDALAPTVFALAHWREPRLGPRENRHPIKYIRELDPGDDQLFWVSIELEFHNVSEQVARVDITDADGGELSIPMGDPIFLRPGHIRRVTWNRSLHTSNLREQEALGLPQHSFFRAQFWVRDLGMNVRDTYTFSADLRHLTLDGSRLLISPNVPYPWAENVAEPTSARMYERLDAGEAGMSPAP